MTGKIGAGHPLKGILGGAIHSNHPFIPTNLASQSSYYQWPHQRTRTEGQRITTCQQANARSNARAAAASKTKGKAETQKPLLWFKER